MKLISVFGLLAVGFAAGWMANSNFDTVLRSAKSPSLELPTSLRSSRESLVIVDEIPSVVKNDSTRENVTEDSHRTKTLKFFELLNAEFYLQAMELFQTVQFNSSNRAAELKRELLIYMTALIEAGNGQAFTELADAYLSFVFDDIDVLILLAEFNKKTDYYIEAISVYQLAKEYAYSLDAKQKVNGAFTRFLTEVDQYLAQQNAWYVLSQVYAQSELVGLLSSQQQLRQAEVYFLAGDFYLGRQLISQLIAAGQHVSAANALLKSISSGASTPESEAGVSQYDTAVALEKHGNQYLVALALNERATVRLLMDTGASVTTLSNSAFERISADVDTVDLGTRMFSTANGLTKGRIVRMASVSLGEFTLQDVTIAVLDFEMNGGIDGLLGMNVLGAFRFQIEPEGPKLLLRPR